MPDLSVSIDAGHAMRIAQLHSALPRIKQLVLRDALKTLITKVERNTPTGIKPKKLATGTKRKRGVSQIRWVQTGDLKKSWTGQFVSDGIEVQAHVKKWKYPWVLEEGKYPGVGKPRFWLGQGGTVQVSPRTIPFGEGIFSKRAQGGILTPITKDETFLASLTNAIVTQMHHTLE